LKYRHSLLRWSRLTRDFPRYTTWRTAASGEPAQVDDIWIERVFDFGIVHVAKAMWSKLGIGEAIQKRVAVKKLKAPHEAALFAMAAQRLDRPGSKLACHERWTNIRTVLETLKAVSYRTEKQAIVQTTNPTKSAAAILKKLCVTKPKAIISVS
jgi:hypothetical protein